MLRQYALIEQIYAKAWPIGWSDIALFAIFESGHIDVDQVYYFSSTPKNSLKGP